MIFKYENNYYIWESFREEGEFAPAAYMTGLYTGHVKKKISSFLPLMEMFKDITYYDPPING